MRGSVGSSLHAWDITRVYTPVSLAFYWMDTTLGEQGGAAENAGQSGRCHTLRLKRAGHKKNTIEPGRDRTGDLKRVKLT